jgi:hypothetical protein
MSLKGGEAACWGLIISMKNGERLSLEGIRTFLAASEGYRFEANSREEMYGWITQTLVEQEYGSGKREVKGLLRSYVEKMTGLSRAQVTRLIGQYLKSGTVKVRRYHRNRFTRQYQTADITLLAAVDEAHETLSGPFRAAADSRTMLTTSATSARSSEMCAARPYFSASARRSAGLFPRWSTRA